MRVYVLLLLRKIISLKGPLLVIIIISNYGLTLIVVYRFFYFVQATSLTVTGEILLLLPTILTLTRIHRMIDMIIWLAGLLDGQNA